MLREPPASPEGPNEPWPDMSAAKKPRRVGSAAKRRDGDTTDAATAPGDLSTPFETRPTTRVTDTLERMMAHALNNPAASTVPDSRGPCR